MSSPFRDDTLALEERLRRAEAALEGLDRQETQVAALRRKRRRWSLQRMALTLGFVVAGALVGRAAIVERERSQMQDSARRYQAQRGASDAHRCAVELHEAKVGLDGCLAVTEHVLAERVALRIEGEPIGSPIRSIVARLDVAACTPPPFRAEITFTPEGAASVVRIEGLGQTKLAAEDTLCLDRTFRAAHVPAWNGNPMIVFAEFLKPR